MKKRLLLFLVLGIMLLSACEEEEEYLVCPDNVTKVINLLDCPEEKPICPASCDDDKVCTRDECNAATDYECTNEEMNPCDGNGICETGEFPWSGDCPDTCDDTDQCTIDTFNYASGICAYEDVKPCCGNDKCEPGETYVECPVDCEQLLKIKVTRYEKRQRIAGAQEDLTGTDFIYVTIAFVITNIAIDDPETLYHKSGNGFYYDPFKMRLESEDGTLYDIEYDSDLVEDYLDYIILPKGHTKPAALLFVVPISTQHVRLIAYDKYGNRLDIGDVY